MADERIIVVGGGLAGLSAACELLERGCAVTILEKEENLGGNSSKATDGIAAPGCALQAAAGVKDDAADLAKDGPAAKALVSAGAKDLKGAGRARSGRVHVVVGGSALGTRGALWHTGPQSKTIPLLSRAACE